MLKRIHHIDYVVRDMDKAVQAYETMFQIKMEDRTHFDARGIEVAWFKLEGVRIILVSPTQADSPVQDFLDEYGEGFFHIAYEVEDLDAAVDHFKRKGIRMGSEEKRTGIEGWEIIDLEMDETFGTMTQLVEKRRPKLEPDRT